LASTTTTSNQVSSKKLSEEAKRKLLELNTQLQEQRNSDDTNYIKFKAGETKVLKFEPELTRTDNVSYPDNPKPTLQYKFYASERIEGNKWTKVREWTTAPRWAKLVIALLLKDFLTQEVTRTGSDKNDTTYTPIPFIE
jgi:hypothetical protein